MPRLKMAQYTLHRYSVDIKSMSSTVTSLHFIDNSGGSGVQLQINWKNLHMEFYIYILSHKLVSVV